ncbi:MAG: hypothetical protein KDB80_06965, partial [Planctomycetes bacterium]|nr:hypothetical protein [Planctomycetota bacterium]
MGRLLLLLALGGLAWYGYGIYFGEEAEGSGITELDERALSVGESRSDDVPEVVSVEPSDPPTAGDAIDRLVARLQDGDPEVREAAFTAYRNAGASQRPRIERAIRDLLANGDAGEAVALLGKGNAFLHTDFGREALASVVERIHAESPARALELSTDLLESCLE